MKRHHSWILAALFVATFATSASADPMRALIIDGQNNHGVWPKTTVMMKSYLEQTKLFTVDVARTRFTKNGEKFLKDYPIKGLETTPTKQPQTDPDFKPDFSNYKVVISNFGHGAAAWPKETQHAFVEYVAGGGGFVVVHAANNSFGNWAEYNEIIGIGGWGGRNKKSGPYLYYNTQGKLVRDTESEGPSGHHGPQHPFSIVVRDRNHPITKGMPAEWLHAKDELYDFLRGPAVNTQVLATAHASKDKRGSGRHEPMLMTISYGKGRIFHTPMGHADYSQECVGFIVSLQRGTEWAATGKVTQKIPNDFPTAEKTSARKFDR